MEIEYINNGDEERTIKIISNTGEVSLYKLSTASPEELEVINALDAEKAQREVFSEFVVIDSETAVEAYINQQ